MFDKTRHEKLEVNSCSPES